MRLSTNENDVLLFDQSGKLLHIIEFYCGFNAQVVFCRSAEELKIIDLKTISTIYFCINSISQFVLILKLQKEVNSIYLISELDIGSRFADFSNIFLVDNNSYPQNVIYDIYQKSIELNNF